MAEELDKLIIPSKPKTRKTTRKKSTATVKRKAKKDEDKS
jgi:hypothetical protein